MPRAPIGIVAIITVAGFGLVNMGGGVAAGSSPSSTAGARPIPASAGRVLDQTFPFPPDTQRCRTNLHISCYQPAQLQTAYNLGPLFSKGLDGRGRTIAIVDSFGSPTIREDLRHFDQTFGLPDPPGFDIIQPAGEVAPFPNDPFGPMDRSSWAMETTLDVEWAHVFAPGANILLVETPTSETEGIQGFPEIIQAERYVIDHNLGDVISQSFAATEETFPSKQSIFDLRKAFFEAKAHHVTVLSASGDAGATNYLADSSCCYGVPVNAWPSSDPLVTSVGGTQLHLDSRGNRIAPDNAWNDNAVFGPGAGAGGGGPSHVFDRPAFQDSVAHVVGDGRGTPDISLSSAADGAVEVYSSFCDWTKADGATGKPPLCGPQWSLIAGTSEATPELAGIVAIADQAAGHRLGWLNGRLYHLAEERHSGIVDITQGTNTYRFCSGQCGTPSEVDRMVAGFGAAEGYDMATGLGTVDAARFVRALSEGER